MIPIPKLDKNILPYPLPKEYKELVENGQLEDYLAEPYPEIVIRAIRIFGWTALLIGFSIVLWIIYAILFAYR